MIPRTFHCLTFGCQMNVNDTDWLTRALTARGFTELPPDMADQAAVRLLNTCSVRDKPEQKVYSEIGRIRSVTGGDPDVLVCVGGCVAQQVGKALFGRFAQVRLVFGADGIAQAPAAIERLVEQPSLRISLLEFESAYREREEVWSAVPAIPGQTGSDGNPATAFVNIMQGCDNFCAYCIVPYVRGRQKSRTAEAVLRECAARLERGAREITLLGQNVNSYGQDAGAGPDGTSETGGPGFTELLYRVAALPGLERLRFITPHPKDLAPELVTAFRELPVLSPRLHLPLQSGSDRILAAMGRRYDTNRFRELVGALRSARPDIHFSTDVIVGFPGETEEDFQKTLSFMQEIGFVGSFSFVYSDRPRARATLLPGKVDRATALDRLSRLQQWQYDHAWSMLQALGGETLEVLLEEPSPKPADGAVIWQGKEPHGHTVNVRLSDPPPAPWSAKGWRGAIVPARIEGAAMHSLRGVQAGAAR